MPRGTKKNSKKPVEKNGSGDLPLLELANQGGDRLDIPAMEQWLWDAACKIRGATDAPKFKDFILPLIFYKRLSDVFDDEYEKCAEKFGGGDLARAFIEADHQDAIKNNRQPIVRYYVPHEYRWDTIRFHPKDGLGEFITTAMREVAKRNPGLSGTLTLKDYNEKQSNQRVLDDDRLKDMSNMFLQDFTDTQIEIGDTFRQPKFTVDKKVMRFDYVVANPMWNQDNYGADAYEEDSFERFQDGIASKSSADWGWVQHIWASLKDNGLYIARFLWWTGYGYVFIRYCLNSNPF